MSGIYLLRRCVSVLIICYVIETSSPRLISVKCFMCLLTLLIPRQYWITFDHKSIIVLAQMWQCNNHWSPNCHYTALSFFRIRNVSTYVFFLWNYSLPCFYLLRLRASTSSRNDVYWWITTIYSSFRITFRLWMVWYVSLPFLTSLQ